MEPLKLRSQKYWPQGLRPGYLLWESRWPWHEEDVLREGPALLPRKHSGV